MITGATHPSLVGKPACASADDPDDIIGVREKTAQWSATQGVSGANDASGATQEAAQLDAKENFTPLFPSMFTSSRWVQSDHIGKLVLVTLLGNKDKDGFVSVSLPGLAHQAGCTVEEAKKWIEVFKSPDPLSRSKQWEGRTIEELDGGFRFLNNSKYIERAKRRPAPTPMTGREKDNVIQYNRETEFTRKSTAISPMKKLVNSAGKVAGKQPVNWHPSEFTSFTALENGTEREFFVLVRGFAELAATHAKPEPDFPLSVEHVAKKLQITKQWAGKLRTEFAQKGIIAQVSPYSRERGKSARYQWAIETTLPIPPMPSSEPDSDLDEESIF